MVKKIIRVADDMCLPQRNLFLKSKKMKTPSIVWVHEYSPLCLQAILWAWCKKIPSIVSTDIGDNPPEYASSKPLKLYQQFIAPFIWGVIANTPEATRRKFHREEAQLYSPHAICVHDFPVRKARDEPDVIRFVFVGRLISAKGIERLIEHVSHLADMGYDVVLNVVGAGTLSSWVQEKALDYTWLKYHGFIEGEELRQFYKEQDVFVFPSKAETYGVVIHEATAAGLAIIVSQEVGSAETLVQDGVNGTVLRYDDDTSWVKTMEYYCKNQHIINDMGRRSREIASKYCVTKSAKKTVQWLQAQQYEYLNNNT